MRRSSLYNRCRKGTTSPNRTQSPSEGRNRWLTCQFTPKNSLSAPRSTEYAGVTLAFSREPLKSRYAPRVLLHPTHAPGYHSRRPVKRVRNPLWTAAALVIVVAGLREAQSILLPIIMAATSPFVHHL